MQRSIEHTLLWIIRLCIVGIVLLPFVVTMETMFPYIFSKVILFRVLIEIAVGAWLFLAFFYPTYRPQWRHPLILSLTAFIVVLIFTMLTGVDPADSFWSTQERMTGVLTFIHLWFFVIILCSTLRQWREWRFLLFFTLAANAIGDLYGIIYLSPYKTIFSTLGNPIYVGVYAMLNIFIAAFLLAYTRKMVIRIFLSGSIILNLYIILNAGTRSVLYAFLVSLLIWVPVYFFNILSKKRRVLLMAGLLFGALFVVSSIVLLKTEHGMIWGKRFLPYTVSRSLYGGVESNADRVILWKIGLLGFRERPFVGWGWENYRAIYEKYLIPRPFMEPWYDRSHNQIIDILALTGIIGFLAYLAFWGTLFFILLQNIRRSTNRASLLSFCALGAFFSSYFLQNLTIFDSPVPLFLFFFMIALAITIFQRTLEESDKAVLLDNRSKRVIPIPVLTLLFFLVCTLLPTAMYFFNIKPYLSSKDIVSGVFALDSEPTTAFRLFQSGVERTPYMLQDFLKQIIASADPFLGTLETSLSTQDRLRWVDYMLEKFAPMIQESVRGTNIQGYITYSQIAIRGYLLSEHDGYLQKAEAALDLAEQISPKRREIMTQRFFLAYYQGKGEEALLYAKRAVPLASEHDLPIVYFHLAQANFLNKDVMSGIEAFQKAETFGYPITQDHGAAIVLAQEVSLSTPKDIQEYIQNYFEEAFKENSKNLYFESARVIFYHNIGKSDKAAVLLQILKEKNKDVARQVSELLSKEKK